MTRLVGPNASGTPQEREPIQNYLRAIGVPQDKLTTYTNAMAYGEGVTSDHFFGSNDHMDVDALTDITRSLPQNPSAEQTLDSILQATAQNPELRNLILKRTAAVSQNMLNDLPAGTTNPNDPGVKRLADLAYGADLTTHYRASGKMTGQNLITAGSSGSSATLNKLRTAYSENHTADQLSDDAMKAAVHNIALAMTPRQENKQEDTKAIEKNEKLLGNVNAKKINVLEQQLHNVAGTSGMSPAALSSALEKKYRGSLAFNKDGNLTCAPEIKAEMDKTLQKADIKGDLINAANGQPTPPTPDASATTPTPKETHTTQEKPTAPSITTEHKRSAPAAQKKAEGTTANTTTKQNAPATDPKIPPVNDPSMILFMGQLGITGDAARKEFAEQHKGKLAGIQDFERTLQGFDPDGKRFTGPHSKTAPTLANTPNLLVNDAAMTETQRAAVHTSIHQTTNREPVESAIRNARQKAGINGPAPWEKGVPPSSNRAAAGLQKTLDNAATLHPGNSANRNVTGQESPQGTPDTAIELRPGDCVPGVCMDLKGNILKQPAVPNSNPAQPPPIADTKQPQSQTLAATKSNWDDNGFGWGDQRSGPGSGASIQSLRSMTPTTHKQTGAAVASRGSGLPGQGNPNQRKNPNEIMKNGVAYGSTGFSLRNLFGGNDP